MESHTQSRIDAWLFHRESSLKLEGSHEEEDKCDEVDLEEKSRIKRKKLRALCVVKGQLEAAILSCKSANKDVS